MNTETATRNPEPEIRETPRPRPETWEPKCSSGGSGLQEVGQRLRQGPTLDLETLNKL